MTRSDHANLWLEIFEDQIDENTDLVPDEERYMAAIDGSDPLTEDEQNQLLMSPLARERFGFARRRLEVQIREEWDARGWGSSTERLLAASSGSTAIEISGEDFDCEIFCNENGRWFVNVVLRPEMVERTVKSSNLTIQLIDDRDRIWVEGSVNMRGHVTGEWKWPDEPPAQMAPGRRLRVQPCFHWKHRETS